MILARAPYRITLGGGGTDLPSYYENHGGFVLSAAITKYLYVYANQTATDDLIRLKYAQSETVATVAEIKHDLLRAILEALNITGNLELAMMADLPTGAGLGSSSTYTVAVLSALLGLQRRRVSLTELAEAGHYVERVLAHLPVGKQDHYLAAYGGITCLEIARNGTVTVTPLKMTQIDGDEFRANVLLFFTGITRRSTLILRQQSLDTQRNNPTVIDSLHRTKELGYQVKETLEGGDLYRFGVLLDEHWENKKRRSTKITTPEIDMAYRIAKEYGAVGGKIMGAGGGGFFMFYCHRDRQRLRQALARRGLRELRYDFAYEGAKIVLNL